MNKEIHHEDILKIFRSGTTEERIAFVQNCSSSSFQDGALSLAQSDNPAMLVMALNLLSNAYCFGQDAELGAEIALAGHEFALQVYKSQGEEGTIFLYTVSGFALNFLNALNLRGKFEEAIEFADDVIPLYEKMGELTNLPEIRVKKIAALFELNRIDEAKELIKIERTRGTSSLELNRLEEEIKKITRGVTKIPKNEEKTGLERIISTEEGHERLRDLIDKGTRIMTKSSEEMNEWKAKKIIRDATSIFLHQPTPEEMKKSLAELLMVREWTKDNGSRIDDNDALWGLYLCYNRLKESSKAADMLKLLRENIEDLRAGISDPFERGGVASKFPYLFPALCKMLLETNRTSELLDAIEGAKGRAIADVLSQKEGKIYNDRQFSKPAKHMADLMRKNAAHYITFFVDDDETYAVLVAKDGSLHSTGSIPLGKDQIRGYAENVDPRNWGKKDSDDPLYSSTIEDSSQALSILFDWLEPYFKSGIIEEGDHICYSPDEHLHHIPLHYVAFCGSPIVEKFSVSRTHGAYGLSHLLNRKPSQLELYLSIEVPTQQNLREDGQALVKSMKTATQTLTKRMRGKTIPVNKATMRTLSTLSLSQCIVHFTTHGIFPKIKSDRNPFHHSGLVLASSVGAPDENRVAKGEDFDLVLTPERVLDLGLDFSDSHVTMQACVSGLAKEGIGGDALGLEWALIQAGASSILSSHWYVRAKLSAEFFDRFYSGWLTSKLSRATAWRQAILELKNSSEPFNAPYCWAAFSLSGDWR